MISLVVVIILAITGKLANMDIDYAIAGPMLGILAEVLLIWIPISTKDKWYKKMSYFKYLYTLLF